MGQGRTETSFYIKVLLLVPWFSYLDRAGTLTLHVYKLISLNFVLELNVLHHFTTRAQARNLQVLFILPQTHTQAISLKCNSKGASSSSFFYFYCEFLSWGISFLDNTAVKASSLDRMHPAQPFPKAERSTTARLCLKPSRCIAGMK